MADISGPILVGHTLATCPHGYRPYVDNSTNALNPCFISLVTLCYTVFFIVFGAIQLYQLLTTREAHPNSNKQLLNPRLLSRRHVIHLTSILFNAALVFAQLQIVTDGIVYPAVLKYSLLSNLLFTLLISFPTQYVEYFKSTCSMANQLFFYTLQVFVLAFQVFQRFSLRPNEELNVIQGTTAEIVEIVLLLNSLMIFVYDLNFYKPIPDLVEYYKGNGWFLTVHVYSELFFTWMNDFINKTYADKRVKDPNNLPLPPVDLEISSIQKRVAANWEEQKWKETNSLYRALWKEFGGTFLIALCFQYTTDILTVIQPQLLKYFIACFKTDVVAQYPLLHGFFLAVSLFLTTVLTTIFKNQFYIVIFQVGLGIRGSLMSLIYQKSLDISTAARNEFSTGDILNFMSVDVLRIQRFYENAESIIGAPAKIIVVLIFLYFLLGNAVIGGLVVMVIMMPINSYLSRRMKSLMKIQMKYKDERIRTTTEILNSMKSIKLYSWEQPMLKRLFHIRNDLELVNLKKIGISLSFIFFAWNSVPLLVTCSTFGIFTYINKRPLTPELVFPALSLFNILSDAIFQIPSTITNIIETTVSVGRIRRFLLAEELDRSLIIHEEPSNDKNVPAVEINNATFLWKSPSKIASETNEADEEAAVGSSQVALKNIDHFEAKRGELTCVVGRVGAGKSTLLKTILGQLPCVSGSQESLPPKIYVRGSSIAYCPQESWVMNDTIKANILFGHKYDEEYYRKTVEACQLLPDFTVLADGDETVVGEKGISLSGGQKARLSLARAIYSRADIYLLDDILSAVDAGVRRYIIRDVLDNTTGLLRTKTVILTTNTISVLKHSQKIYALQNGEIVDEGNFDEITAKNDPNSLLNRLLQEFSSQDETDSDTNESKSDNGERSEGEKDDEYEDPVDYQPFEQGVEGNVANVGGLFERRASLATLKKRPLVFEDRSQKKMKQESESMAVGSVKLSVYFAYARACGLTGVAMFFIFLILSRLLELAETFWLKYWSEYNEKHKENAYAMKFVAIYALIGILSAAFNNLRNVILLISCSIRAARKLHDGMIKAIIRAPMQFFETTPIGRITNRFAGDLDAVDNGLHRDFTIFFRSISDYVITVILVSVKLPWFFVFNAFLLVIYIYYQKRFLVQQRDLKRLTSISFSPIMSLLGETLQGKVVIDAYNHFKMFKFLNINSVQSNVDCSFAYRSTNRWLTIRLETIGAAIVLCTAIMGIATVNTKNAISTGMIGLLMSYVLNVTSALTWIVRSTVLMETNIISVERILEYTGLKPEAPEIVEGNRPKGDWPSKGAIKFVDYTTAYRENLDAVLKKISLTIKPTEKIGIVGRTGAGKSTLTLSLFRLLEPREGTIIIDDVDIKEIGLHDLRSHLAIIPQDAQAFEGTIRYNLDPFDQYSEEQLWEAIELSHLKYHLLKITQSDPNNFSKEECLNFKVSENGSNLSLGQRQLMCLARALLNKSKILVLDEATAAVDVKTDQVIQETIRSQFTERTILTIAHRLDTVMDSDRILVLDNGEVKEFDSPENLLADPNSLFSMLCKQGNYVTKQQTPQAE